MQQKSNTDAADAEIKRLRAEEAKLKATQQQQSKQIQSEALDALKSARGTSSTSIFDYFKETLG